MDLRPYQVAAIDETREKIRASAPKVLIIIPTGGGKTVVAAEIIRSAESKGSRVLFLAHRRELIQQTCDKLRRFGVRHGVVMAGMRAALQLPVQVASVQTLARRPGVLSRVDLIFLDEAHHVTTENQYSEVLGWYPAAKVVGLTATPWRLDGKGLADVFGAHVIGSTPRQLRDEGFLVPVGGWEYEGIDTSGARVERGDYRMSDIQASATSRRVVGDIVTEWQAHAAGRRTILFASSVAQSQLMVAEFQRQGVAAEHVDGTMPAAERDGILARLREGRTLLVSNCNVLTEGFDCPELEVCILARPTLSTSLYLQMVGRVLRPAAGKALARIHDHAGCLRAHGHPYAERDYNPEKTVRGERGSSEGGAGAAANRRCAACKSIITRWPCDACGYAPDPKELQLEYDPAAARREITSDGVAPKRADSDADRRRRWRDMYAHDEERKRSFFRRMVARHGPEKGARVYWWFSGKSERPPRQWLYEEQRTA